VNVAAVRLSSLTDPVNVAAVRLESLTYVGVITCERGISIFLLAAAIRPLGGRVNRYGTQSFTQAAAKSGKMPGGLFHFDPHVARITMESKSHAVIARMLKPFAR
jgi:hypothetical protein